MSPMLAPDRAQIERALDDLLQRDEKARILAMRSPQKRAWPEAIVRGGCNFHVAWCASELEIREHLDRAEAESDGVIVLTPLDETALSSDVIARFPRARLKHTDRWSALRALFKVSALDPRLASQTWLADLLLDYVPKEGYKPAPGGVLDLDTAWRAALGDVLELPDGRGDASSLMEWALEPVGLDRLVRLPQDVRSALIQRLGVEGGAAASLVLAAASQGRGSEALALSLVCGVLFGEQPARPELREAAVRLETYVGGVPIEPAGGAALARAGRSLFNRLLQHNTAAARSAETRATEILIAIRAEQAVDLSPVLQAGFEAQLRQAAAILQHALATGAVDDVGACWRSLRILQAHDRAGDNAPRLARATMAIRLVTWLTARRAEPARGFAEAAATFAVDGGFVDHARNALRSGDPLPEVASVYARISQSVGERREAENQRFAILLKDWNQSAGTGEGPPWPVERVLEAIVAPLARDVPVLLLVFDGLSFPVWRALGETLARLGWLELNPTNSRAPISAVAAIPSVTEISRASLLSGTLRRGDQAAERAGFSSSGPLLAVSRSGLPPRLFHKADLGAGPELGEDVRRAIADTHQKIVGVVHNAVDAQLAGSDQLDINWSADEFRQVGSLLHAARQAGRTVVITGDHGHVLDTGTVQASGGSGDRWRVGSAAAADGEIALSGGRVLSPAGGTAIVAAWSERLRYAAKRKGYHGGVAPQEVLVPVSVLTTGDAPTGWVLAPPSEPSWWLGSTQDVRPAVVPAPSMTTTRRDTPGQFDLFGQPGSGGDLNRPQPSAPTWIDTLIGCENYLAQRSLAGRGAPPDDQIKALLVALSGRGGRMSKTSLAQGLGIAAVRLGGFVSAARRVLNLDQAQVIALDGDDVILDEALLRLQFELGGRR
ncbi:BREX-2 system phosphatase PglZ [Microvirga pakistanensis]|uniref:BREX-2 system phosphatase PglZ n=1 Tax=Microvirga pakistanensis TaxID=1682650 RepID=UPI00106ABF65|nr:BREX-2 system phosphatase PglZ [Microvirga pakistanensis]